MLKEFIFSALMPIHHESVSQNIDKFMSNTASLGAIGVVFVLYVSIMFFDDFEYVINRIFKETPRDFLHSISIYIILTVIIPIGLLVSIFLSIKATILVQNYGYSQSIDTIAISSYLILWALFFIVYKISPNVKVYFQSAFLSSFLASAIWFASKQLFVYYVTFNKTYTTIYGSFSTIMFFLIWIYLSWIIFLFGAKLCYYLNENKKKKIETKNNKYNAFMKYSED
jgi:membrane protein